MSARFSAYFTGLLLGHYGAGIIDAARAVRTLAGLAPPPDPELTLATESAHVEADESTLDVHARNDGGGTLAIGTTTTSTEDDVPWLTAAAEDATIHLEVDRDALAPGSYVGRVDVASNGGGATIAVTADVDGTPPEDLGPVMILLRDFATHTVVATTTSTAAADYRYRFDDVPPGRYEIIATTDRDLDGAVCDLGESCGIYPDRSAPRAVTLSGGGSIPARDFGMSLVVTETP
jgi:serine protease